MDATGDTGLTIGLVFHDRVFAATRRTFSDTALAPLHLRFCDMD